MSLKGHHFLITARDKDVTFDLLNNYEIPFVSRGKGSQSKIGKYLYFIQFTFKFFLKISRFKPDICIAIGSPYVIIISRLFGIPGIVFEDTEIAKQILGFYKLFADVILTPSCFRINLGKKHLKINAYKELAYLHCNHNTSDYNKILHIGSYKKNILMRFVSHKVNHDSLYDGLNSKMKKMLVERLSLKYKILVSTEKGLSSDFTEFEIEIHPEKIHDLILSTSLLIGESATMAAEAAVLGIPSIFIDNHGRGYTDELENIYQMVSNFKVTEHVLEKVISKAVEILETPEYVKEKTNFTGILKNKIDITAFLVWFVENYPQSRQWMIANPDLQYRFSFNDDCKYHY
jgi:hypothetical protein